MGLFSRKPKPPAFRALVAQAVEIVGSQPKLAARIGRSQQQIWALMNTAEKISAEDAIGIHIATAGEVPASSMRPDLWRRADDVPVERFDRVSA